MLLRNLPLFLSFCAITILSHAQEQAFDPKKYSVEELQEDFNYMRNKIQSKGTVIYLYNTKKETDDYLDSMYACMKEPMTAIEFFRFTAPLQVFVKDVHTGVFPGEKIRKSFFVNQHLFPLDIEFIDKKVFIGENLSDNPSLSNHQEIRSINSVPIETIIENCLQILPREGYDTGYPLNWLNNEFLYYYYFVYGTSESYQLELRRNDGLAQNEIVRGLSIDTIWANIDKLYPESDSRNVFTTVNDSLKTVTLTIKSFDDHDIKANHGTSFRKVINEQFEIILKTGYSNLIIDVRNNDGGNSGSGRRVLQYLLDERFEIKQSVRVVKNKRKEDLMKRTRPALYGQFQRGKYRPHKVRFQGDVYVLVNAGSTSAAVVFAAALHKHQRATFVGTEMGGNPIIMGGGIWDNVKETPNTGISFMYGNKLNILDNPELNTGHGLIPDYLVERSYEDFLAGKDTQMLFTIKMIGEK